MTGRLMEFMVYDNSHPITKTTTTRTKSNHKNSKCDNSTFSTQDATALDPQATNAENLAMSTTKDGKLKSIPATQRKVAKNHHDTKIIVA